MQHHPTNSVKKRASEGEHVHAVLPQGVPRNLYINVEKAVAFNKLALRQ
jgi:hypothetical protein